MARAAFGCTISNSRPFAPGPVADPQNAATVATTSADVATEQAAVEALVAVLEADAATPTQAHVNDLRAGWDLLVAAIAAYKADVAGVPARSDVVLSVNATNVATRTVLRGAVRDLLLAAEGSDALTP